MCRGCQRCVQHRGCEREAVSSRPLRRFSPCVCALCAVCVPLSVRPAVFVLPASSLVPLVQSSASVLLSAVAARREACALRCHSQPALRVHGIVSCCSARTAVCRRLCSRGLRARGCAVHTLPTTATGARRRSSTRSDRWIVPGRRWDSGAGCLLARASPRRSSSRAC